jgi:hypothetical protein
VRQQHNGHANHSALLQGNTTAKASDFLQFGVDLLTTRRLISGCCVIFLVLSTASFSKGQEVVDRIVARVENDIIL